MSAIKEAKLTQEEVSQEIDLKEALGEQPDYVYREVAQKLIDRLVERTASGESVHGKSFSGEYSEDYADSLEFKAYGKDKSEINLKQTGSMLNSVDLLNVKDGVVKIGINDPKEAVKAYAHHTGFEGHSTLDGNVNKREWFGVKQKELKEITKPYKERKYPIQTTKTSFLIKYLENL